MIDFDIDDYFKNLDEEFNRLQKITHWTKDEWEQLQVQLMNKNKLDSIYKNEND